MIKINTSARWFRWLFKPALILLVVATVFLLLTYLGGQLFLAQKDIVALGNPVDDFFWGFVLFRFTVYALIYWKADVLFVWILRQRGTNDGLPIDTVSFRRIFVRVVLLYELLFPFDLIGHLSRGGM